MPLLRLSTSSIRILRAPRFSALSLRQSSNTPLVRSFSIAFRLQLKEDADRSGDEVEAVKQKQLKKQEKGEGHWHEELASQGETSVKADRQQKDIDDHGKHMEKLQEETAERAEEGKM